MLTLPMMRVKQEMMIMEVMFLGLLQLLVDIDEVVGVVVEEDEDVWQDLHRHLEMKKGMMVEL
jgi:hypothetical protein